ncbi:MAG: cysteine hydrolase [Candidatus Melainabacteria bacterium HGW-Melainabacteria-1]|nr:MAG: cysteine hydrolase [Candidatus Melainabacteria bacterium HGW-Melainabacteria-1]
MRIHSSALLIIDLQQGLLAAVAQPEPLLEVHRRLLSWAQQQDLPVLCLQHDGAPDSLVPTGSLAWELDPLLNDLPVIRKAASDGFYQTDLEPWLVSRRIGHLIVSGIKSERCVDTTARAAVSRGLAVTLVADGHATVDTPVLDAEAIVAFTNYNLQGFGNARAKIEVINSEVLIHRQEAEVRS